MSVNKTSHLNDNLPFAGIKVLDFSRVLAGPYCTAMLADMGAQIIKVEPPSGDDQRYMGAFKNGISLSFELINRNKQSICIDLKTEEGRQLVYELVRQCDVVVENFRPGVAKKLGIDHEALKAHRPDLVYCSISGFGQAGPMKNYASYDVIAQALSGLMSITGEADREPMLVGDSVGDTVSGLYAAFAIATALFRRATTGAGASVDIAMFDALFSLLPTALANWQVKETAPQRHGSQHPLSAPFGAYQAADGTVMIAIANNSLFARFAQIIGRPELCEDERFANDQTRNKNKASLKTEIESWLISLPAKQAAGILSEAGIPASVVWNVEEAATSEHAQYRQLMTKLDHDIVGSIALPEQPVQMDGVTRGALSNAPKLGENSSQILSDLLHKTDADIARLKAGGVI